MSPFDGERWQSYVIDFVCPDFQKFGDVVRGRILPVFDHIRDEADDVAKCAYKELMSTGTSSSEDWDGGAVAEQAMEAGFGHYETLTSMKSATLNLYAAALYHLTEQHIVDLSMMIVNGHGQSEVRPEEAIKWLDDQLGLKIATLQNWPVIHELRLVANVVKHAEGRSAAELRKLQPALFERPQLAGLGWSTRTRVRKPLFGQDIYVTANDFERYHEGSVTFWTEVANELPKLTS